MWSMLIKENLSIGFIGYGKQAIKIYKIVKNSKKNIFFDYNKKKNKINKHLILNKVRDYSIIDDLKKFLNFDIIFILSPNNTHFYYLNYLFNNNYKGYIFCEKPICDKKKDYEIIKKFLTIKYKKTFFNFNYRNSVLFNIIKKKINSAKFGKIVYFNLNVSQGLAFKKEYVRNWRSKSQSSTIISNKSIHLIDITNYIFNNIDSLQVSLTNYSKKTKVSDTAIINIYRNKKNIGTIISSYATPLNNEFQIIGTNSILNYRDNKLIEIHPRDSFDTKNYFKRPKEKIIFHEKTFNTASLKNSLKIFFKKVNNKKYFKKYEMLKSLETHDLMFKFIK